MYTSLKTLIIASILVGAFVFAMPLQTSFAADKTIDCTGDDGCKINFKGKNNIDIQFAGAGQGEKGDKGDTGDKGDQGEVGPAGEQGVQGDPGPTGQDGVNGTNGINGTQGPEGAQGPAGTAANGTIISDQDYSDLQTVLQMLRNGTLSAEVTEVNDTTTEPPIDNGTIPIPEPNPDEPPVDNNTNTDNETNTDNNESNNDNE